MASKVLYMSLTCGLPGIMRKADKNKVDVGDADPNLIRVSKEILDSETYRLIRNLDTRVRQWLYGQTLPAVGLKRGVYAVPVTMIEYVENRLEDFRNQRMELVARFISEYPVKVEEAKKKLGGQFEARNYPSTADMTAAFTWGVRYLSFDVPGDLQAVSKELYDRERAKAEQAWQETLAEWQKVLRVNFADLVDHCAEKLTGERTVNGKGKAKIFRDSLVENVREFIGTFEARNVVGDDDLKKLVEKARALTEGVDPQALRDDKAVRDRIGEGFREIKGKLDTMIVDRPVRKISFENDGE